MLVVPKEKRYDFPLDLPVLQFVYSRDFLLPRVAGLEIYFPKLLQDSIIRTKPVVTINFLKAKIENK